HGALSTSRITRMWRAEASATRRSAYAIARGSNALGPLGCMTDHSSSVRTTVAPSAAAAPMSASAPLGDSVSTFETLTPTSGIADVVFARTPAALVTAPAPVTPAA